MPWNGKGGGDTDPRGQRPDLATKQQGGLVSGPAQGQTNGKADWAGKA